jgi:hypothetical protein
MIYRGPGFSPSYDLTPPPPYPVSKLGRRHTGRLRKRNIFLTGEGGGRSQIIRRREILALYKSFSTLCLPLQAHETLPFQAAMRNLWLGQTIKEAIDGRRIHHQLAPMHVSYEPDFSQVNKEQIINKTKRPCERPMSS